MSNDHGVMSFVTDSAARTDGYCGLLSEAAPKPLFTTKLMARVANYL
jgi:hypothetical protein